MSGVVTRANTPYSLAKAQAKKIKEYREESGKIRKLSAEEQKKINREAEKKQLQTILAEDKKKDPLIVVDAGHGGDQLGSTYGKLVEKNINLNIAIKVKGILTKNDYRVIMTRTNDSKTPNNQRWKLANKMNASLFISCSH